MSDFHCECVRIGDIVKHPNADALSTTMVHGVPVIIRTEDFKTGDLAVYVPIDALVPVIRPEFKFLDDGHGKEFARIRARKLRGVYSEGLIVPLITSGSHPNGFFREGDDMQAELGIEKYLPPSEREDTRQKGQLTRKAHANELYEFERNVRNTTALCCALTCLFMVLGVLTLGCTLAIQALTLATSYAAVRYNRLVHTKPAVPVYDIEGLRRHSDVFEYGEPVSITEKIHGCNARYVHTGRKFHHGSRTMFRTLKTDVWHRVAARYELERKLSKHPNVVVFGEIYGGKTQDLNYGVADGQEEFMAFDVMDLKTRRYYDVIEFHQFCHENQIPTVPELYRGPLGLDVSADLPAMAEGKTTLPGANHVREGFVIKPMTEQTAHGLGRKFLKLAGQGYKLRKSDVG